MSTNTPSYLLWITKPDGTVVLAYLQLDRDHVLHIATEEREYYSIEFTGNYTDPEYMGFYLINLKTLIIDYYHSGVSSSGLTGLGDGKYTTPGATTKYASQGKEVFLNNKINIGLRRISSQRINNDMTDRRFYGVVPVFFPSYKDNNLYVATDYVSTSAVGYVSHLQIFYV